MEEWFHCNNCLTGSKTLRYYVRQCGRVLCQNCAGKSQRKDRKVPCDCGRSCSEVLIDNKAFRDNLWFLEPGDAQLRRLLKAFDFQEGQRKQLLKSLKYQLSVATAQAKEARRDAAESRRLLDACEQEEKDILARIQFLHEEIRVAIERPPKVASPPKVATPPPKPPHSFFLFGTPTQHSAQTPRTPLRYFETPGRSRRSHSPSSVSKFDSRPTHWRPGDLSNPPSRRTTHRRSPPSSCGSSNWDIPPVNSRSRDSKQYGFSRHAESSHNMFWPDNSKRHHNPTPR